MRIFSRIDKKLDQKSSFTGENDPFLTKPENLKNDKKCEKWPKQVASHDFFQKKIWRGRLLFFTAEIRRKNLLRADIFRKKGVGHFATLREGLASTCGRVS